MWLRPRVRPAGGDDCRKPWHSPAGVSVACDYRQAANKRQLLAPEEGGLGGLPGRSAVRWECSVSSGALGGFYTRHPPPGARSHSCPGWHRCRAAGGCPSVCPSGSRVCSADKQPVPRSLILPEHPRRGFYRRFSFNHAALREHASVMLLTHHLPATPWQGQTPSPCCYGAVIYPPAPGRCRVPRICLSLET